MRNNYRGEGFTKIKERWDALSDENRNQMITAAWADFLIAHKKAVDGHHAIDQQLRFDRALMAIDACNLNQLNILWSMFKHRTAGKII